MKKYLPESILIFMVVVFFASSLLSDFEVFTTILIKGTALLLGLLAFLFIAADKYKNGKYKIIVLIAICISGGIYLISMPYLFRSSVKLYILRNEDELMEINNILLSKNSDITYHKSRGFVDKDSTLNNQERLRLNELMKITGNYWVGKYDNIVNYELYGFLDNRYGIIYSEKEIIDPKKEKLAEHWYLYNFPH